MKIKIKIKPMYVVVHQNEDVVIYSTEEKAIAAVEELTGKKREEWDGKNGDSNAWYWEAEMGD